MSFARLDHWVWDFWLADDGANFHLFYLHAPKSLGDPDLRHRNARIGHATSPDLLVWTDHGQIFDAGPAGAFDDTANWTGSVVRGDDGRWYLYYTGSHFLSPDSNGNIETIGLAVSDDLFSWTKLPGPICKADARWYETLGTSSWPEEAWRDPWVFRGADGYWHMLITARANHGDAMQRGIVGHAVSTDMVDWEVRSPLSEPGADFAHLEVFETFTVADKNYILFSCDTARLAGGLAGLMGGIWYMPVDDNFAGPFDPKSARLLATQILYAGRVVKQRNGQWALMGFENELPFTGRISDPIPLIVDPDGVLTIADETAL